MSTNAERVARIVEADRAWFQKEDWAQAAGQLRNVVRTSEGADQERAKEALQDHYGNRGKDPGDWSPLVQAALARAGRQNA